MDAGSQLPHATADLEQPQPQRLQGQPRTTGRDQPTSQRMQRVGGGMEEQADLVGEDAMTGEPIRETGPLQILDPVLRHAAIDVGVLEPFGRLGSVGDHEADIRAWRQDFGLDDDPASDGP